MIKDDNHPPGIFDFFNTDFLKGAGYGGGVVMTHHNVGFNRHDLSGPDFMTGFVSEHFFNKGFSHIFAPLMNCYFKANRL
jgi:hypothetical protein